LGGTDAAAAILIGLLLLLWLIVRREHRGIDTLVGGLALVGEWGIRPAPAGNHVLVRGGDTGLPWEREDKGRDGSGKGR
jgi:hypothetical protein